MMNLSCVFWSNMANTVTSCCHEFRNVSSLTETLLSLRGCQEIQSHCHKVAAFHSSCSGKEHWKEKWITRGNPRQMQGRAMYIIYDHKTNPSVVLKMFAGAHLPPTPAFVWIRMYKLLAVYSLLVMPQFQHIKSTSAVQPVRIDED